MLQKTIFYFLAIIIVLQACNTKKDVETTKSGIKYKFYTHDKKGKKGNVGDFITFHMTIKNSKDSTVKSTYETNMPVEKYPIRKPEFNGALDEMFTMVSAGDSLSVWLNVDSLSKVVPVPPDFEKGSDIHYVLKILSIQSAQEVQKGEEKIMKEQEALSSKQKEEDMKIIQSYLDTNKLTAQKTNSGLHYIITKEGQGVQPQVGDTVSVHYTGKLLSGTIFDSSINRGEPFDFTLGIGMVIPGWDEGIALLKKGGKATLFIPSGMAYGPRGAGQDIPPNAVLIFDVELINIK